MVFCFCFDAEVPGRAACKAIHRKFYGPPRSSDGRGGSGGMLPWAGCVANRAWDCRLILVLETFFREALCSEQFLGLLVDSVILVLESFVVREPWTREASMESDSGVRRVPLMSGQGKGGRTDKGKERRARRDGHWVSHTVPTPLLSPTAPEGAAPRVRPPLPSSPPPCPGFVFFALRTLTRCSPRRPALALRFKGFSSHSNFGGLGARRGNKNPSKRGRPC
jgi:hypothetical protein